MNRIVIDKEEIILEKITKKIEIVTIPRKDIFGITKISINVLKDCDLEMNYNIDNCKLDIVINIMAGVNFNLYEYKSGNKGKIQYTFNLYKGSYLCINKFSTVNNIKEMIIANLKESGATVDYNFKNISFSKGAYDMIVNHDACNTISNIKNNAVNLEDGKINFQVSGYVDNGIKGCVINQTNRIINLTNNKCEIRPNLYINEYDTIANHSALIGGFSQDELFYLQSRGINEVDANRLLIHGFLVSDLSNKKMIRIIERSIKEYWR